MCYRKCIFNTLKQWKESTGSQNQKVEGNQASGKLGPEAQDVIGVQLHVFVPSPGGVSSLPYVFMLYCLEEESSTFTAEILESAGMHSD